MFLPCWSHQGLIWFKQGITGAKSNSEQETKTAGKVALVSKNKQGLII